MKANWRVKNGKGVQCSSVQTYGWLNSIITNAFFVYCVGISSAAFNACSIRNVQCILLMAAACLIAAVSAKIDSQLKCCISRESVDSIGAHRLSTESMTCAGASQVCRLHLKCLEKSLRPDCMTGPLASSMRLEFR